MSTPNSVNLNNLDGRYSKPADVAAAINAQAVTDAGQYALKASPTFTGTVILPSTTPSSATQAVTKGYVDTQTSSALQAVNNLSDIANAGTARTNLGVDSSGTPQPSIAVSPWTASTSYVKGQLVFAPVGTYLSGVISLVQANSSFTSGGSFNMVNWTRISDVNLPYGATMLTSNNAAWPIPTGATMLEIILVGGGGGGGGGGSALTSGGVATQVGGGGGGSGGSIQQIVSVGSNTTLNVTVAAGGTGGTAGAANGNAGTSGGDGASTSVVGAGISLTANGGTGGQGGVANGTTTSNGGVYGIAGTASLTSTLVTPGYGGYSTSVAGFYSGGAIGWSGGPGGGGVPASATLSGQAGNVPTATTGSGYKSGKMGSSVPGGTPVNSPANTGCGGAGGGGGAPGQAGGAGGNGGSGYVVIKVIG